MRIEEARNALTYIKADDRDDWLKICFALKNEFGEEAFTLFDEWSSTSVKYQKKSVESTWRYTKPKTGGITIGTLIKMAKQGGWQPAKQPRPLHKPTKEEIEAERKRIRERAKASTAEQERIYTWAANKAKRIIAVCQSSEHPYLKNKGFPEIKGLVIKRNTLLGILRPKPDAEPLPESDPLIIPLRNRKREVTTLQMVFADNQKRFLGGGKFGESAHSLGTRSINDVWLCEGYATGLSILEALRENYRKQARVVVCFSNINLVKVAKHFKRARIIADHDYIDKNTGKRPGIESAKETGHPFWHPPYEGMDANDYHLRFGMQALTKSIMTWLAK